MRKPPADNANLDVLFLHVPKLSSYYKPIDEFLFINYIPMGVFAMCDILNKNGFSSRIRHLGLDYIKDTGFSIARYVVENRIRIVALSLHWHYQAFDVIDVAGKIKARSPDTVIVIGGFTASLFAEEILTAHPSIDFIIAGDGEKGILDLVRIIKNGGDVSTVANCHYREHGAPRSNGITYSADPASFSDIDYANLELLYDYEKYRDYFKMPLFWSLRSGVGENMRKAISGAATTFPLMVGRGCNFDCSFCGGGRMAQNAICRRREAVFMPISKVVETMEQALSFGYESFIICFDPTPANQQYFVDLFTEIRRRNLSCGMGFESWGLPTSEFITAFAATFNLKKSYIAISPETASEQLRRQHKGPSYSNAELFESLTALESAAIPILIYLTLGLPGETMKDIDANAQFARQLRKKFRMIANIITIPIQLEPASPMFSEPAKFDIVSERSSFADFYAYHGRADACPFTYLGYVTASHSEAGGDIGRFAELIAGQRCTNFCTIGFKLFGKFHVPAISRLICTLSHKRWLRRGFGKPAEVRRTFS
jgi:radical SAM superfamily enzyme YgiQ (UPF0313 family)